MKHHRYKWDLQAAREAGFEISDRPQTAGPIIGASGLRQIADLLSDAPRLSQAPEVRLEGARPGCEVYIKTETPISKPQIVVGYQPNGRVALLSALDAFTGGGNYSGLPGGGKSTLLSLTLYQLNRLGFCTILLAMKAIDFILLASLMAAAVSKTRVNAKGEICSGDFSLVSLDPNLPSQKMAGLLQAEAGVPPTVRAARLLSGLGQIGGAQDATRRYFNAHGQVLLQSIPDWGQSPRDLHERIQKMKLSRDTLYSTSGLRNEIAQQAAIEVANATCDSPGSVRLTDIIANNGALYVDACSQVVGESATAFAGLALNNFITAKRIVDPENQKPLFVAIDECQQLFRPALKLAVEQVRGFNIKLLLAFHTPSQFGEDWESITMARTKMVISANPGGFVDRVILPRSFGTKRVFRMNFGSNKSVSNSTSVTVGPTGTSYGSAVTDTEGFTFGLSEQEVDVFGANETLDLNNSPTSFVLQVSPGCDLAHFGPKPIICERGSFHMTHDEVRHFVKLALDTTRNKLLTDTAQRLALPEITPAAAAKRQALVAILNSFAAKLRQPNA